MPLNFDHKLAIAIIVVVVSVAGMFYVMVIPMEPYVTDRDRAVYTCVFLCKAMKNEGQNLDSGPCLSSNSDAWEIEDWVCDVAHSPRKAVDNLPQNQCPGYDVTAQRFVEVDPDCSLIRAV